MALKLDMKKAFDRFEWSFLAKIFSFLGFNEKWIQLILQCISSVSYSIWLNGSAFGKFSPNRGIRQGNPLSSFLFILGMEILSRLFDKEEREGNLHGIKVSPHNPAVSHLMYADDLLAFSEGTTSKAACILKCLDKFSSWSG